MRLDRRGDAAGILREEALVPASRHLFENARREKDNDKSD